MNVKLIAHTAGVGELEGKSIGEIIGFVARVSNPDNQMNFETTPKLLKYCLDHGHVSIFETCSMTLEITTSMSIFEQILRHRSATFQKFSLRYSAATEFEEGYPARAQDTKNRQNSTDDLPVGIKDWFATLQQNNNEESMNCYQRALERGVCREQARLLLPASTQTTGYMTNNIRGWIHYCQSRDAEGVQKEHRDIAIEVKKILLTLIPELKPIFEPKPKEPNFDLMLSKLTQIESRIKEMEAKVLTIPIYPQYPKPYTITYTAPNVSRCVDIDMYQSGNGQSGSV